MPASPSVAMIAAYTLKSASVEHRHARNGAAGAHVMVAALETHAGVAGPHLLDHQRAAAGMDLRKARVDQGFETRNIEAIRHGFVD